MTAARTIAAYAPPFVEPGLTANDAHEARRRGAEDAEIGAGGLAEFATFTADRREVA